jgi:hypothetical protein
MNQQSDQANEVTFIENAGEVTARGTGPSIESHTNGPATLASQADDPYLQRQARGLDQFTACQNATAIMAFAKFGGKFTDQDDILWGNTAAHLVAGSEEKIEAFAKAGGKFHHKKNLTGETPAHYAGRTLTTMRAFVRNGGRFTDLPNQNGESVGHYAAKMGAEAIKLYADNGGTFTNQKDRWGNTAAYYVCGKGAEESIASMRAFIDALAAQQSLDATPGRPTPAASTTKKLTP